MKNIFLKRKPFFMTLDHPSMLKHALDRSSIVWIDSKGNSHNLDKMDSNYIKNCIKKIKRGDLNPLTNISLYKNQLSNELIYREILKTET